MVTRSSRCAANGRRRVGRGGVRASDSSLPKMTRARRFIYPSGGGISELAEDPSLTAVRWTTTGTTETEKKERHARQRRYFPGTRLRRVRDWFPRHTLRNYQEDESLYGRIFIIIIFFFSFSFLLDYIIRDRPKP